MLFPLSFLKKRWLLFSLFVLLGSPSWGQTASYETYKQAVLDLMQTVQQDSLDAETEAIVDTLLLLLREDISAVTLLELMTIKLSEVNVGIHNFPLEVGEITEKMFQFKLKEELPPKEKKKLVEYFGTQQVNQAAMLNVQNKRYEAFQIYFQALEKLRPYQDTFVTILLLQELGVSQFNQNEFAKAEDSWIEALELEQQQALSDSSSLAYLYSLISVAQVSQKAYDTARIYVNAGLELARARKDTLSIALSLNTLTAIETAEGNVESAYLIGKQSLEAFEVRNERFRHGNLLSLLFVSCIKLSYWQEAYDYLRKMENLLRTNPRPTLRRDVLEAKYLLAKHNRKHQEALEYYQAFEALEDSIEDLGNTRALLDQQYKYEYAQKAFQDSLAVEQANAIEQLRLENQVQTRGLGLLGMLVLAIAVGWIAFVQYRSRKQKQQLAEEIRIKNHALEHTLDTLKTTQDQLIMQEKMASLGSMTAGIAHEIKNPLNFVQNFSQVAKELVGEFEEDLNMYLESNNPEDLTLLKETIEGIRQNTDRIYKHGERATQIVEGMMEHAQDNEGQHLPVQINSLLEDSVHLAYKAYRAKQESFHLHIRKAMAEDLPSIEANPQDLQRVIINLVNNACYAMEKKKQSLGDTYSPKLSIQTEKKQEHLLIRIRDNGTGIPKEIQKQIFQPFFTTKATGKGNIGLGLSISYDLITQGYQGSLSCESKEGEYTSFEIALPLS
ncbi:MAG: ATP-binding protein [Bacteroidota bacterium]